MATKWYLLSKELPDDGQIVNIRLWNNATEPIEATWDEIQQHFVSVITAIIYPAWCVWKWQNIE